MALGVVHFATLPVSRLILGGNPFSGFSHQNPKRDREMRQYYTTARIKETMREAERLGINTFCGRADRHIVRTLREYWDEGGTIQWLAQTCPEYVSLTRSIDEAIKAGASAIYIHGGHMDNLLAQGSGDVAQAGIEQIHKAGLPAGLAGHTPAVFHWAEEHVAADFYMCSYYNPTNRANNAEHVAGSTEYFGDDDRERMATAIATLRKPVIHYKIFAAGRNDPQAAFAYLARQLRPDDAACIGVFTKDDPHMLAKDLALFEQAREDAAALRQTPETAQP